MDEHIGPHRPGVEPQRTSDSSAGTTPGKPKGIFRRFAGDSRGNVLIILAIALPVMLAMLGLGFEIAQWYQTKRSLQNAADAAALAAATNGASTASDDAKATAASYGFSDGTDGVAVTVTSNATTATGACSNTTCPGGTGTCSCYSVKITKPLPIYLLKLVGYVGGTTYNGQAAQDVSSEAYAKVGTTTLPFCLYALASGASDVGVYCTGCPQSSASQCNALSASNMSCSGSNHAGFGAGYAAKSNGNGNVNKYCGNVAKSNVTLPTDPYATGITVPTDACASYPGETWGPGTSITIAAGTPRRVCGNLTITGNVTISADSTGSQLIIYNGSLKSNGSIYTIKTTAGYLTLIMAGTNSYTHYIDCALTLDWAAPTSGSYAGLAIYYPNSLTNGVTFSSNIPAYKDCGGNTPTLNITGMIYMPKADVAFNGAINKSSTNGLSCAAWTVNTINYNGTGLVYTDCISAGVKTPTSTMAAWGQLAQ